MKDEKNKKGLGRGLMSLFGDQDEESLKKNSDISNKLISIGDLNRSRFQPRTVFNDDKINELAESIKQNGLIQPIAVRPDSKDGKLYDKAAKTIREAGFSVIREPIEGFVSHNGKKFDTNYMNWLVGNGFVIVPSFGNPETDFSAKLRIERYFPNRDVYLIEMLNSWAAGGGVHCHTNDQPALSISK